MTRIRLLRNSIFIVLFTISYNAQYINTAPTTFSPLISTTIKSENNLKYQKHLDETKQTQTDEVLMHFENDSTSSFTTTRTTTEKEIKSSTIRDNVGGKVNQKIKIDPVRRNAKIFSSSSVLLDKQQNEHTRKLTSKKLKDKNLSMKSPTLKSEEHHDKPMLLQDTTTFAKLEQQTTETQTITVTSTTASITLSTLPSEIIKTTGNGIATNSNEFVPKNDVTILSQSPTMNDASSLQNKTTMKTLTQSLDRDQYFEQIIDKKNDKNITMIPFDNANLNESLKNTSDGFTDGFPLITNKENNITKNSNHFPDARTTTATTTPVYNTVIKSEDGKEKELNSSNVDNKTVDIILRKNQQQQQQEYRNNTKKIATENFNDAVNNANQNTSLSDFSTTASISDFIITKTTSIPSYQRKEETQEKIIKLFDVEKIDSKLIKNYSEQINTMFEKKDGGNGSGDGTIFGNFKKKTTSGIVMGHDGVKITKKKQLLEKHFNKNDDNADGSISPSKTQTMKMGGKVGNDNKDDYGKTLTDNNNDDNDDDRVLGRIKENENWDYKEKSTSVQEPKVHNHDDNDSNESENDNNKKLNLKKNESHLQPLIIQKNLLDEEKNGNLNNPIVDAENNNKLKEETNLRKENVHENLKVENISPDFDALDIETNLKKVRENEKLKFVEKTNFENSQSPSATLQLSTLSSPSILISDKIIFDSKPSSDKPILDKQNTITFTATTEEEILVNRTDATEPQVVTERSITSNSFTNENKNSDVLDIDILPSVITTSENIETIPTLIYPFTNLSSNSKYQDVEANINFNTSKLTEISDFKNLYEDNFESKIKSISNNGEEVVNFTTERTQLSTPNSIEKYNILSMEIVKEPIDVKIGNNTQTHNQNQTNTPGIEIQINVSEGFDNGQMNSSHLLEFSFRKNGLQEISLKENKIQNDSFSQLLHSSFMREGIDLPKASNLDDSITLRPSGEVPSNENDYSNESDILVVEITDGDTNNSTAENANSNNGILMNENPKFTIHNDRLSSVDYDSSLIGVSKTFSDYEKANLKSKPNSHESSLDDDDLFVPDLKLEPLDEFNPVIEHKNFEKLGKESSKERDSDTIFYISNTEVKVVESKPTPITFSNHNKNDFNSQSVEMRNASIKNYDPNSYGHSLSGESSPVFPSIFEEDVIIDFPNKNSSLNEKQNHNDRETDHFEEDIILSPLKNNFNPLKEMEFKTKDERTLNDNMSVSYVGESFIEVEESPNIAQFPNIHTSNDENMSLPLSRKSNENNNKTKSLIPPTDTNESSTTTLISNVIIQPAIIPEMSIGVPVIGELPPQIQLKDIDFMSKDNKDFRNENENDDDIQYGGDLIARGTSGVGYGVDSGYDSFVSNNRRIENLDNNNYNEGRDVDIDAADVTSQIVMHAVHNLQKDQLTAEIPSESAITIDMRDNPSKRAGDNNSNVNGTMPEKLGNATAYSVLDENEVEFNFTDLQTLILACFTTLIPLILLAVMGYVVRFLWIKYGRHGSQGGSLVEDNSTDPLAAKSMNLSQNELKSTESGITINRSNDTLESNTETVAKYHDDDDGGGMSGGYNFTQSVSESTDIHTKMNGITTTNNINHSGANGSVITMTLKNNHLIVETEERNDISRDARETKMHYTPSDKDGVFVVEVARGADSKGIPASPRDDSNGLPKTCTIDIETTSNLPDNMNGCNKSTNHEEVQIHQPPADSNNDDMDNTSTAEAVDNSHLSPDKEHDDIDVNLGNSNTGLSQSDLSTSSGDSNKGYTYGNQQLYEVNGSVYADIPNPVPTLISSPSILNTVSEKFENEQSYSNGENISNHNYTTNNDHAETKPIIKAALLKQDTVIEVTNPNRNYQNIQITNVENGENGKQTNGDISPSHNFVNNNNNSNHNNNNNNNVNDNREEMDETELNTENGFDSIISLPAPPSTEEIKQMNDVILVENTQLDSLPPPPPPNETIHEDVTSCNNASNVNGQNGNENDIVTNVTLDALRSHPKEGQNGVAIVAVTGSS